MRNRWCVVALVLVGCAVDPIERVSVWSGEEDECDPLVCSGNSDLIGVLGPYELDETGTQVSPRGWRIADVKLNGQAVDSFQVAGASVYATHAGALVTGADLVGLKLTLQHTSAQGIDTYEFEIMGATNVPYYVGNPTQRIQGFHVTYNLVGGPRKPLCPYATYIDHDVTSDWAVFWRGDRFNPITGRIFASDSAVGPWFNLSCAGEAPIKMLRARTGGAVAPSSPVDQRQATLNMFTASYCGPNGQRYTKLGQAITWSDRSGPSHIGDVSSYEALWTANGAACLNTPRFVDRSTINCQLPTCSQSLINNWQAFSSLWLLSGNPLPGM